MNIIELLEKETTKSFKKNEVPVGCVIVKNGKIISKAHNTKQSKHLTINHAEILAINKAQKKVKDWRLDDCELYVSLKPCNMCLEVIKQSRIKKVYYVIDSNFNNESTGKTRIEKVNTSRETENKFITQIKSFFELKR